MENKNGGLEGLKKVIVINDLHVPFHDKKLYSLFKVFLKDFKPDLLIINGDFIDCWEISKYDRVPRAGEPLRNELNIGIDILRELAGLSKKIWYLEGNHEFRLKTYLLRQAPELYGLADLSIPYLLKLGDFGIEWFGVKDGANSFIDNWVKLGQLYVGHFAKVAQHSAYTAKALVEKKGASILQGHVHRYGVHAKRLVDGHQLVGIENFCMCDLNPNYAADVNWQQGWSVIYLKPSSGRFHAYPIHAINYGFIWNGKFYELKSN